MKVPYEEFFRCVTLGSPYIHILHKKPFSLSLLFSSFLRAVEKGHILLSGQSKGKMALQQMHHLAVFRHQEIRDQR